MFRRLLKSARAPAGKVKRKNGSEAAVAISESSIGEAPNAFINHVAAVSWAATQTPETTLGNHSPTKAGFLSANQMEVFCFSSLAPPFNQGSFFFLIIGCERRDQAVR